ncbi:MAG: hypothetical protein LBR28_07625 [Bacteroidales bacterium]|jgi:hypothetical protein|nr:hypothetical protein [Bacteroidales bacterium]
MQKRIINILLATFCLLSGVSISNIKAQTTISSPYSHYGIGNTNVFSNAVYSSLGNVGYAFRKNNLINLKNPASYSGIDTMSFVFDVGFYMDFLSLSTVSRKANSINGALSHITMAFPINNHLKMAVGLIPMSNVYYTTSQLIPVEVIRDTSVLTKYYRNFYGGEGGLNKVLLGAAYDFDLPKDKFSLGLNVEYLFGSYIKSTGVIFYDNTDSILRDNFIDSTLFNTEKKHSFYINNFNFNFGFQYFHTFNNGDKLGIGGSFIQPLSLKYKDTSQYFTYVISNGTTSTKDVVYSDTNYNSVTFPQSFGIGLSYEKPHKFLIGMDILFTKWSEFKLREDEVNEYMKDNFNIGIGGEFTPDIYGNYLKQIIYRVGFNYDNGYLFLNNNRINQYSIAAGFGLPIKKSSTLINMSFEYGIRGTTNDNLIRENFFRIGLSLSAKDRWFFKRKYQ